MREEKFKQLFNFFVEQNSINLKKGIVPYKRTGDNIWGVSSLQSWFRFFLEIELQKCNHVLDLGSGDGRVVFLASLFTQATGVEVDSELVEKSKLFQSTLEAQNILSPNTTKFVPEDYANIDFSLFDCLCIFPDKPFSAELENKIRKEFKGLLLVYENIYLPTTLGEGIHLLYDMPLSVYNLQKEALNFSRVVPKI